MSGVGGLGAVLLMHSVPGQAFLSEPLKLRPHFRVVDDAPGVVDQVEVHGFQSQLGRGISTIAAGGIFFASVTGH